MNILDSFSFYGTIYIEKRELETIQETGYVGLKLMKWITEEEQNATHIPAEFQLHKKIYESIFQLIFLVLI
jgi:hypothetical protein